jgi:Flp pilus assembly pilin Flp
MRTLKDICIRFVHDERGVETIEAVILMIAIVAIGFAFKSTLTNWFNGLVGEIGDGKKNGTVNVKVGTFVK